MTTTAPLIVANRSLILFVDDEPSLQKQVTSHLTGRGMEVVAVGDGDLALLTLRQRRPALLCVNLSLPRMSGYEVCEQVRSDPELDDLVVLMTSERVSLEARAYAYEAGANAYLSKPYSLDQLAKVVETLLDPAPDDEPQPSLRLA
jgi:DNA-binding response OmpR family regulator